MTRADRPALLLTSIRNKLEAFFGGSRPTSSIPRPTIIKVTGLKDLALRPAPVTVIFLHYHPQEFFSPGYVRLIESAASCGYRVIVASSARPSRAQKYIGGIHLVYVQRHNLGYDFASLIDVRNLLSSHGLLVESRYVVINSSLLNIASEGFGRDPILQQLAHPDREIDLLGVTSSYERMTYHIQTYYYSYSARLFCSKDLHSFFRDYAVGLSRTKLTPRNYAIRFGELELTAYVMKRGFSATSIFEHLHLSSSDEYSTMISLVERIREAIQLPIQEPACVADLPTLIPGAFMREWRSVPGLQTNISQSCWALLLANQFLFIKRELLENHQPVQHCHATSAVSMLLPVLRAMQIELPQWSDLHVLPRLIFASKP
ncbi:MAG: hypothetical protein AAFX65_00270 [Cyanobacteria bacterium J06638_7]